MRVVSRSIIVVVATVVALTASSAAAQNNPASERIVRKIQIGANGRVTLENLAGHIQVTGAGGDEITIEATKETNGNRSELADLQVQIDSRPGRVDIRTEYPRRSNRAWVDYKLTVPTGASVELHGISSEIEVNNLKGALRAESVSGSVRIDNASRVEQAKSVSGSVSVTGVTECDLDLSTVSGSVQATNIKVRSLNAASVSGQVILNDTICDRLRATSVSGSVEYAGSITEKGRYEVNTHSGSVRFQIPTGVGFDLQANTFSGSVRSDFAMTVGGDGRDLRPRGRDRSLRATFGDGSAELVFNTFSGSIALQKR